MDLGSFSDEDLNSILEAHGIEVSCFLFRLNPFFTPLGYWSSQSN
jgi:hypothetical protein